MDFEEIKEWFDSDKWDIGYLTKKHLEICSMTPIKGIANFHGWSFINDIHYNWINLANAIVLIRHSSVSLDYGLYEEATEILTQNGCKEFIDWGHVYTNFKWAEIFSGRGVRARNSLVYNYKFGFDTKICVVGFMKMIQNPPKNKRVAGNNFKEEYWNKCIGCDACRENCPVGAIHNNEEVDWMNSAACDNFLTYSDHPRIPSMKKYWHENVRPDIPKEMVDKVTSWGKDVEMGDGRGNNFVMGNWNANGYTSTDGIFRKNGKTVPVPICRECQVQAPCSSWDGKYPYGKEEEIIERNILENLEKD